MVLLLKDMLNTQVNKVPLPRPRSRKHASTTGSPPHNPSSGNLPQKDMTK